MLWILIGILLVALIGIAGFHVEDAVAFRFQRSDFTESGQFLKLLKDPDSLRPAQRRVRDRLSDDFQERLDALDLSELENRRSRRQLESALLKAFNDLLASEDLHDPKAFANTIIGAEARVQLEQGTEGLALPQRGRLNRLLLDATFPDDIKPVGNSALSFFWFAASIVENQPMTRQQLIVRVQERWLINILNYLLGGAGILAAILVTSAIVPRTFEPGEIDLLLSKPVSRIWLFLTRFAGGCVTILLLASLFVVGLWLIVGWRLDLWMPKLLLCIPAFVFTFTIFYSVSVWFGVIWRNPIISVVCTMVFWVVCFAAEATRDVSDLFLNGERIEVLSPGREGALFVARKSGQVFRWDPGAENWQILPGNVPRSGRPDFGFSFPLEGPVYDKQNDRLLMLRFDQVGFGSIRRGANLLVGSREDDWEFTEALPAPIGDRKLTVLPGGQLVTYGERGTHRFEGETGTAGRPFVVAGFDLAKLARRPGQGRFIDNGPADVRWKEPFDASLDPDRADLVVVSNGRLILCTSDETGQFLSTAETDLGSRDPALVSSGGNRIAVALGSGEVRLFAKDGLSEEGRFQPYGSNKPKDVQVSPDGRWVAVLFHHRELWLYDANARLVAEVRASAQGHISSILLEETESLWVAGHVGQVTRYSLPDWSVEADFDPEPTSLAWFARFVVEPVYTVFPKPGQLDNVIRYIITGEETASISGRELDLRQDRAVFDIDDAIWSNLAFISGMLIWSSLIIWRRDF